MDPEARYDAAEDYFERERDVLRSGRLDQLDRLAEDRQRILADLPLGDSQRLKNLRRSAARNGEMMAAAAQGIRSALGRLAQLRRAAGPIDSYAADGGRREIGQAAPSFNHKA